MSTKVKTVCSGQGSGASKNQTYTPNQTLYVTNIPSSKIQKDDIRRSLYILFSIYGPVLDVVALRTMKMRGQAHIVFRDVQTATVAMRELQGFELFGMEMKIEYAKTKSDIIAKLDGTFRMPAAAAAVGAVTATELQQSIFNLPPSVAASLPPKPPGGWNTSTGDITMGNADVPDPKTVDSKQQDNDEPEEDSEGDVAMDEDSDDD
ncbi:hypothetical protein K3495_g9661 [Podosphaera aphanis]|nr:hypothetical protein K3495_g9661 [Podosphaera aphanis]